MTFWWITSVKRLIPVLTVKFINLVCLKINAFPLPLQSYDSWIVVKENPDKKMLKKSLFCGEILIDLSEVSLYSQVLLAINRYANCVKNTWICSFCWSVFSCIQTEYGDLLTEYRDLFCKSPYSVRTRENMGQKKFRIGALFTHWC